MLRNVLSFEPSSGVLSTLALGSDSDGEFGSLSIEGLLEPGCDAIGVCRVEPGREDAMSLAWSRYRDKEPRRGTVIKGLRSTIPANVKLAETQRAARHAKSTRAPYRRETNPVSRRRPCRMQRARG